MSTNPPDVGALNTLSLYLGSLVSSVVFEWVALIPLVIYLSTYRHSYKLVGKASLSCALSVTIFPKLGILSSIADLLVQGSEYLDRACSVSELRKEIWDANFGGRFPCANGAASEIITSSVMRDDPKIIDMPGTRSFDALHMHPPNGAGISAPKPDASPQFHRYQTLHVLYCTHQRSPATLGHRMVCLLTHRVAQFAIFFILLGGSIASCVFGLYGTGVAVLSSALFQLCQQFIRIHRPGTYLLNNEANRSSGCMLAGTHQNASTWYLYIGDRGIIDSLLNKPMILSITTTENINAKYMAGFLKVLGLLQLLSMTFAAAHKGWDGVGMLALIILAWAADLIIYGESALGSRWLSSEGISIKAKSFQFSGRTIMIGTIQVFKKNPVERWMDEILAPSDRRKVWLEKLKFGDITPQSSILSASDQDWVERNLRLTCQSVEILRREFPIA